MSKRNSSKKQTISSAFGKTLSNLTSLLKKTQQLFKKYNYFEFLADGIIDYVSKKLGRKPSEEHLEQLRKLTAIAVTTSFSKTEIIIHPDLIALYKLAYNVPDKEVKKLEAIIREAFGKVLKPIFNLQSKIFSLSIKLADTIQQKLDRLPTIKSYYERAKNAYRQLQQYFNQDCNQLPYTKIKGLIKELIRAYIVLVGVYDCIKSHAVVKGHIPADYRLILIGASATGVADEIKKFIQHVDDTLEKFFKEVERSLQKKTADEFIGKLIDLHSYAYEFDYFESGKISFIVSTYIQQLARNIASAYKPSREKCIYSVTSVIYRQIKSVYDDILEVTTKAYDTIVKLKYELAETKDKLKKQKEETEKYKSAYEKADKQVSKLRRELLAKEDELYNMSIAYKDLEKDYDKLVNKYNKLVERNSELINKVRSLQSDLRWAQDQFELGLKGLAASGAIVFIDIIIYVILAIVVARRLHKNIVATILNPVLVFKEVIGHVFNVFKRQSSFQYVPLGERIYAGIEVFMLFLLLIGGTIAVMVAIHSINMLIGSYKTAEKLKKEIENLKTENYLI